MSDDRVPGPARESEAPPGAAQAASAPPDGRPALHRSGDERMVAGVCGGLAAHFAIDPVIFRVVFAVLTLFGGVGVLLYGLAWVLVPAENAGTPLARRLMSGRFDSGTVAATVVVVMGVALFFTYLDSGFWPSVPLLMITSVVLFMVWTDTMKRRDARVASPVPGPAVSPVAAAPAGPSGRPADPPAWWRAGAPAPERPAPPAPPPPPKRRPWITLATLAVAAIAGGVMWLIDDDGSGNVSPAVAVAVLLGVVSLGLIAGAFLGRARLLILPAVLLTAALAAVTTISEPLTGPSGRHTHTPVTTRVIPDEYRMGMGELDIDLRRLDLGPASAATVKARMGMGVITVWVPEDVRVVLHSRADLGSVGSPAGGNDGYRPEEHSVLTPGKGPERGTLTLDLKVSVGEIKVRVGDHGWYPV